MEKVYNNIIDTIGRTPLVKLNRINSDLKPTILAKIEAFNPGGSVKDRIGFSMIFAAEEVGLLNKESHIVEPTSGNTGIALALICAAKGYKLTLTMPSSMSVERQKILKAFGANLILTDPSKGMKGAIEKAEELANEEGNVIIPQQFKNKANPEIHRKTTAQEILHDTSGKIDAFVAGVGTGGTITGVGEVLREKFGDHIRIIAVEPIESPILSGGKPGPHKIQGIGAGFVPEVLNTRIYDRIITVSYENAKKTAKNLARLEGIFAGISSGAATWAALEVAKEFQEDQTIVVILPDTGERYLTTDLYDD
ncbi:MAG TPA: cysteine synthase A [Candidatus Deferrimicrobium sp.]|nr:cysteine synthase A [Candidatus Deferrimicrobium sp.]